MRKKSIIFRRTSFGNIIYKQSKKMNLHYHQIKKVAKKRLKGIEEMKNKKNKGPYIIILSVVFLIIIFCISEVKEYLHFPSKLIPVKSVFEKNMEVPTLDLGKEGKFGLSIANYQVYQGKFYYNNGEKLVVWDYEKKESKELCQCGNPFWINNDMIYYIVKNNLYRCDLKGKQKTTILSDIIGKLCFDVVGDDLYYFSKEDYCLRSYNMVSHEIKKYGVEYGAICSMWIKDNFALLEYDNRIVIYDLQGRKRIEFILRDMHCICYVAKTEKELFFCISGYEEGDIMTKKNWGDNGVYKVNLIQMKIQKISEENYDWIFTNGDRLYGVKDYFGELYCKREEIE